MKVYEFDGSKTIDGIRMSERPVPAVGRGQVLVRMHALSMNYRDLMILDGRYSVTGKAGQIPISDGAGEVVEAGEGVSRAKKGDRVMGTFFPRWLGGPISRQAIADQPSSARDGMAAEYVVFDEDAVVQIPDHMTYEEGSTLPCAALTAWVSLNGDRPLLAGETVLTQGTGGVSIFALQFAKAFGARVIVTTSDDKKAAHLKRLGADDIINYKSDPEWAKAVKKLTGGDGADHILEIGGAGTLEKSIAASSIGAVINMIGVLENVEMVNGAMFMRGITTIRRISVGNRADFEAMNRCLSFHRIKPVIDRVFPFSQFVEAFRHFESRQFFGKVVISVQ